MKDLTIEQFVRENLPDFMSRLARELIGEFGITERDVVVKSFIEMHFPEALAAYSERLCREQRAECYKASFGQYECDHEAILVAPSPSFTKTE